MEYSHNNAFGINFPKADLPDIIQKCNEALPLENIYQVVNVDWEIPADQLKQTQVREVAENYAIWGNTVPAPTFAITNIRVNASQINGYGDTKSFIKFQYNGVTYIKKYCANGEYDRMTLRDRSVFGVNTKNLVLNVIAQFQNEIYEDKVYPEVKILYYDVQEDTGDIELTDDDLLSTKISKSAPNSNTKNSAKKDNDWDLLDRCVTHTNTDNMRKDKKNEKAPSKDILDDDDIIW